VANVASATQFASGHGEPQGAALDPKVKLLGSVGHLWRSFFGCFFPGGFCFFAPGNCATGGGTISIFADVAAFEVAAACTGSHSSPTVDI
jgi:hypothetical protein